MVSASRSPAWFTSDADPDAPPAVIQLIAAGDLAVIELGDGQVRTRLGRAADPDLVLDGPPRAVLGQSSMLQPDRIRWSPALGWWGGVRLPEADLSVPLAAEQLSDPLDGEPRTAMPVSAGHCPACH